jgi:putative ABC transport system permease protein
MPPLLKIAWRNLVKHWRKSLASMLAISLGFLAVCVFQGFMAELQRQFEEGSYHRSMLGDVLIRKTVPEGTDEMEANLTDQEQEVIDAALREEGDLVSTVVRKLYVSGMVDNGRTSTIFVGYGHDVAEGVRMRGPKWAWNALAGVPLHESRKPNPTLVGRKLGLILDCEAEAGEDIYLPGGGYRPEPRTLRCFRDGVQLQAMTESAQLNAVNVSVDGLMDSGFRKYDDKYMVMPLEVAQRLMDTRAVSTYSVGLSRVGERDAFISRLVAAGRKAGLALDVQPWQQSRNGNLYRAIMSFLGIFKAFVLVVAGAIGAMGVANTLARSVVERTREIGALRSMGYRQRHITLLFSLEGLLLALIACGVGLVATLLLSVFLSSLGLSYSTGISSGPVPLVIHLVPGTYAWVAVTLCGVSTCAALIPALRAARMPVADALGHV